VKTGTCPKWVNSRPRGPGYSEQVRAGQLAAVTLVAAVLGGAFALAIGKGSGWFGESTKTVVVNANTATTPAALPANATSNVAPLAGKGFSPERIFAQRSPGVVTIFSFFGDPSSQATEISQGSGFVISPKGYILTNSHVITNAGEGAKVKPAEHLYVEFSDGNRAGAKIVGWDLFDDVGLIQLTSADHKLTPVPLGESKSVAVGEPVAAIGSPLGQENSLAVGVVSAVHRSIDAITVQKYKVIDAIQTDAPITHGNSGGPLFDARGRVIGINAQIRSQSGSGNDTGVGFAIPIDAAKRSVQQLLEKGRVTYAFVGLQTDDMTPSLARALHYPVDHGALVVQVESGSPAAHAGFHGGNNDVNVLGLQGLVTGGDVIVAINGTPVDSADDVVRIVSGLRPKDVAVFTIVRDGKQKKLAVTLAERQVPSG
jgi:2-alkenal reductase